MRIEDIYVATTYATTTGILQTYIPLPAGLPDINYAPTTQYLLGGILASQPVQVKAYKARGVTINTVARRGVTLRLRFLAVGELVRT